MMSIPQTPSVEPIKWADLQTNAARNWMASVNPRLDYKGYMSTIVGMSAEEVSLLTLVSLCSSGELPVEYCPGGEEGLNQMRAALSGKTYMTREHLQRISDTYVYHMLLVGAKCLDDFLFTHGANPQDLARLIRGDADALGSYSEHEKKSLESFIENYTVTAAQMCLERYRQEVMSSFEDGEEDTTRHQESIHAAENWRNLIRSVLQRNMGVPLEGEERVEGMPQEKMAEAFEMILGFVYQAYNEDLRGHLTSILEEVSEKPGVDNIS